jgi:hypothetical protein
MFPSQEEILMAEINKLSVSKVLDKLRSNDEQKKTKDVQRDEQLEKINEELAWAMNGHGRLFDYLVGAGEE